MFCVRCGRNLEGGDVFCPECGKPVGDPVRGNAQYVAAPGRSTFALSLATAMVLVYSLFAIVLGLALLTMGDAILAMMEQDPAAYEGFGLTPESFGQILPMAIAVFLVSGVLAAISAAFVINRKNHTVATLACLGATLVLFVSFDPLMVGIGLLATLLIYVSKPHFVS